MPTESLRIPECEEKALQDFVYTPLKNANEWIRLLRFFPRPKGASLRAMILHVKLCDTPRYRALSYTWGALSDVHTEIELCTSLVPPIVVRIWGQKSGVNGFTFPCNNKNDIQTQRLPIRPGLEAPMQRLESLYEDQYIWIDAICIDQRDDFEKGHQVSIMSHIYRRTAEIDIWLGEEEDESDLAMDLIIEHENTCGCGAKIENIEGNLEALYESFEKETESWTSHWRALGKLLSRPWFTRRWIIQETAFAQQKYILCGSKRACWFSFRRFI